MLPNDLIPNNYVLEETNRQGGSVVQYNSYGVYDEEVNEVDEDYFGHCGIEVKTVVFGLIFDQLGRRSLVVASATAEHQHKFLGPIK